MLRKMITVMAPQVRAQRYVEQPELQAMPPVWGDLAVQPFERLSVIGCAAQLTRHRQKQVVCQCSCGFFVVVAPSSLRSGATTSCGCVHGERVASRNRAKAVHGHARGKITPEYRAWQAMRNRCRDEKNTHYKDYGGRGIFVCPAWQEFAAFLKDVGTRPSDAHSLDRYPNPNGNYEPGNVRWATAKEQGRNLRNTRRYAFRGELLTIEEVVERTGAPHDRLYRRLKMGWSIEDAILAPSDVLVTDKQAHMRWYQMIARCHDSTHPRYKDYGGRGIFVWPIWRTSFAAFLRDVGHPPSSAYTLDRKENDKGYEPGNVKWATNLEQNRNRRNTRRYELQGVNQTLAEWAVTSNIPYVRLKGRLHAGWSLDEALGTRVGNTGRLPIGTRRKWTERML
jgi:hypothetical protein